ncbi:MAG: hypothetical protein C0622_04080 [Desulfuromonas sp.]|nr:MAG: hypothetical protein C0622_04080 [Desulfuromonas sp.]
MARNKHAIQWGVLVLALLLIAGTVIHNLYNAYEDILVGEKGRLLTQAKVLDVNFTAQLNRTASLLSDLRDELGLLPSRKWSQTVTPRQVERLAAAIPGIRTILALDARGAVRLCNHPEFLEIDLAYRDDFQKAQASGDPASLFVSPPFQTLLDIRGMTLSKVIPDLDGAFSGLVVASLDPDYFSTLLESLLYSQDMWGGIIHGEGSTFLRIPEVAGSAEAIERAQPAPFYQRHLASKRRENLLRGDLLGEHRAGLMALRTLRPPLLAMDEPLLLGLYRDRSAVLADWYGHVWGQGLTFLTIAILASASLAGFQLHQRRQLRLVSQTRHALRDSRQQLREILDFIPDATFVLDQEKKVVAWNRAIEKMTGVNREAMLGKGEHAYTVPFYGERRPHLLDFFEVDDAELAERYSNIRREGENLDAETFCPALHGGRGAYVWATGVPLYNVAGERIGAIESVRDISRHKKAEEYLHKLTHGIEHSASAMMITDLEGTIEYVNHKFCQLTGYEKEEAIGQNPRILRSDATPVEVFDELWKTILAGKEWRGEILNRRKNGEVYWSIASINPLFDDSGAITHFIANFEDINDRKNAEATIERLAYYDPLTDLPNRRMLADRLDLAIRRSRRQRQGAALFYLDLDSFKHINDTLGHPAGDKLLQVMAQRFANLLRDDDVVFRLGGDEFAMLLHDIHHDHDVVPVAQKLIDAATEPILLDETEVVVTASAGIALFPKDGEDGKSLEKHADIALYHAKSEGKNTFRFYDADLNQRFNDRIAMEQALRRVLERDELELYYQPRVEATTGQVVGVEALLRWHSPEFGQVSPQRFIPLAEETRMIIPIGEWVMRSACLQQLAWEKEGLSLEVSINLSALQFKSPRLIDSLALIFDETGARPEKIEFELTESALVDNPAEVVRALRALRYVGCGIAIDDFGTGYSSLGYLKAFPVTILKIDRTFVRDIGRDEGDRAIAQSVVDLACNLKIKTVAEGVEDEEQLTIMRQIGCTYIQGYYYARPLPADEVAARIRVLNDSPPPL